MKTMLCVLVVLVLTACGTTVSGGGSSQVYGQISGGVGYTAY